MLIHIDRETGKCILPSPLSSYFIEVPDDFKLIKKVQEISGQVQKTNELGEKLFRFVYPENIEEMKLKIAKQYVNVSEESEDYQQKLNEELSKLIVRTADEFTQEEVIEERTPIIFREIEIIRNEQQVLQVEDGFETIINEEGQEEQIPKYKTVYQNNFINDVMIIPVGFTQNEPIMIDEIKEYYVNIYENPEMFTLEEVITEKFKPLLLEDSTLNYLIVETFFNDNSISLMENAHAGVGYVIIQPNGMIKLNSISLKKSTNKFKLLEVDATGKLDFYISNKKLENNEVELANNINSFSLRIENCTDKEVVLKHFCIGY